MQLQTIRVSSRALVFNYMNRMSEQETAPKPPESNQQKQDAKRKKEYEANRAALNELCELYPDVFNIAAPKPLKIGIHEAVAADGKLSKTRIRRALNLYVRMRKYVASLVENAERVTLGGVADGTVTADEAKHAAEKLVEIDRRRNQKKPQTTKGKPSSKDKRPAKNTSSARATKKPKPAPQQQVDDPAKAQDRLQAKLEALVNKRSN